METNVLNVKCAQWTNSHYSGKYNKNVIKYVFKPITSKVNPAGNIKPGIYTIKIAMN